jgi:hypothetical protein
MTATTRGTVDTDELRADSAVERGPVGAVVEASPPDLHRVWTAAIEWRDVEDGPRFVVAARAGGGAREVTIARSDPLEWPPSEPTAIRAVTAAVDKLEATVLAAGWRPLPQGGAWYAKRFIAEPPVGSAADASSRAGAQPEDPWTIAGDPGARSAGRRGVVVATVGQLVLAAAVIGVLLGRGFVSDDEGAAARPATPRPTITQGGLHLQLPAGWDRGRVAAVPGFRRPLTLKNAGQGVAAVVERLPPSSASLLPLAFQKARPNAGEGREVVELGRGQRAWRHRVADGNRSATVLYAAPTTSGVATMACQVPAGAGVPRACDTLAKSITVPASAPLELGTGAAFFIGLPAVARKLDAARSARMRDLSAARSAAGQAAAARRLAHEHRRALAALAPLVGNQGGLPEKTVRALSRTSGAYATLAAAARARSPRRYAAAARRVTAADADLRRTLTEAAAAANAARRVPTDAGRNAP